MNKSKIMVMMRRHKLWLNGEKGGEQLDLSGENLEGMTFRGDDLRDLAQGCFTDANLQYTTFINVDFSGAKLNDVNFKGALLMGSNFAGANLCGANLTGADLFDANLSNAQLSFARLVNTNLECVNLANANFSFANIMNAKGRFVSFSAFHHMAIFTETHGHIGCERHDHAYWLTHYGEIGRKHGYYTEADIHRYGRLIKLACTFFEELKNDSPILFD